MIDDANANIGIKIVGKINDSMNYDSNNITTDFQSQDKFLEFADFDLNINNQPDYIIKDNLFYPK